MYTGVIYKYTSPSNKIYIGQALNEKRRRLEFLCMTQDYAGKKINNARKKYGPENFKYEIVFTIQGNNKDEIRSVLNIKEREYILIFNSVKDGYNIHYGGDCVEYEFNYIITEETRRKRSESMQRRLQNGYKIPRTPEGIASMREKLSIPILLYDKEGKFITEYKSSKEAECTTGLKSQSITKCCKRLMYMYKSYIFVYKKDYPDVPKEIDICYIPLKYREHEIHKGGNYKSIYQLDFNNNIIREFSSIHDAAEWCGVKIGAIIKYIKGKNNHCYKGFIWKYKN